VDAQARFEDIVDALASWDETVRRSKVFGMPCIKRGRRVVAGFSRSERAMVFRLPDEAVRARALALRGAHLFDPSGRGEAFREWVVVPPAHADEWDALAYDALVTLPVAVDD
jgi:hypothetical protein